MLWVRQEKASLDLIMARLSKGKENSITMALVIMCAEKIHRVLRLFASLFLPGCALENGQFVSGPAQKHLTA